MLTWISIKNYLIIAAWIICPQYIIYQLLEFLWYKKFIHLTFFHFSWWVNSTSLNTGVTFSSCKELGKVSYLYSFWFSLVTLCLFFLVIFQSINFKKDYFYVAIYMQDFVNPFTTNVPHHIETIQLICNPNQLTGFYMIGNIGH